MEKGLKKHDRNEGCKQELGVWPEKRTRGVDGAHCSGLKNLMEWKNRQKERKIWKKKAQRKKHGR